MLILSFGKYHSGRRLGNIAPMPYFKLSLVLGLLFTWSLSVAAEPTGSYLEVSPNGEADLDSLLTTLEQSLADDFVRRTPVVIVLHGSEALSFTRGKYADKKSLVDRAALLDAYDLIDVRMCQTWMSENKIKRSDIPAFIDTVPFAPEEIRQLEKDGYLPYSPVRI